MYQKVIHVVIGVLSSRKCPDFQETTWGAAVSSLLFSPRITLCDVDAISSPRRSTMTSPLLLSLTHQKLHAHTPNLIPAPIPHSTPTAIAASPTYVAEGSQSGSLTLRDPFTLQLIHTLPSHTSSVTALAISAAYLAAGHTDGTVSLHNLSSHDHASFTESSPIISLAYPLTARYLAAATASAVALFSTVSNRLITRLTQPTTRSYPRIATTQARFTAVAFSPIHSSLLAATDDTGCLTVYDISTVLSSARTHPLKATPSSSTSQSKFPSALKAPSTDLSFSPEGYLAVAGFDKLIRVFNPSLKKLLFTVALPSPISAIHYGEFIAVGLTDSSIAVVRLDVERASGTVVKRVFVDAGVGAGGSKAVKRVLFQPKPKRRKPPRSATPLNISSHDVNEEMLADVDDIIGGKLGTKSTTLDDDLFSPVRERSPQARPIAAKSASFHASPAERELAARRSNSVKSITDHGNALEDELRFRATSIYERPLPSPDQDWDDIFDEQEGEDNITVPKEAEDSFEGAPEQSDVAIIDDNTRYTREPNFTLHRTDGTTASRSYTRTSSSVETSLYSKENWGERKIVKSMSETQMASPNRGLKEGGNANQGKRRTVRFEYLKDVMLGHPVRDVERTKELNSIPPSTQEDAPDCHEGDVQGQRTKGEYSSLENHVLTHGADTSFSESASKRGNEIRELRPAVIEDEIRDIVRQEIDVVRTDLRSDILNIHAEIITLAARQSQEIATVLKERDHTIRGLEEEVRRLHMDNMRLRRKYGIG